MGRTSKEQGRTTAFGLVIDETWDFSLAIVSNMLASTEHIPSRARSSNKDVAEREK